MARKFTIYYSIRLEAEYTLEADSEDEACDALRDLTDAELVEECAFGDGDVQIYEVKDVSPPHALEQLAEQAE